MTTVFASDWTTLDRSESDVIGLIPAGGQATRLAPLPLSKELYPIGFQELPEKGLRPKVVGQYLLENFRQAGIRKVFFILRPGKWDIPAYFGSGDRLNLDLGYLVVENSTGVPDTLNQAYAFVKQARVALGFPDILFYPSTVFQLLLDHQAQTQAAVVLGLVPLKPGQRAGVVDFDASGRVTAILEKPESTDLTYGWGAAVWSPMFTEFLHGFQAQRRKTEAGPEVPIGDVIQGAIAQGLPVQAVAFPEGHFLDIGITDNLIRAVHQFSADPSLFADISPITPDRH